MKKIEALERENAELRQWVEQAKSALDALKSGGVDAILSNHTVMALPGAEEPYMTFFEMMHGGGLTCDNDGRIMHSNPFFSELVGISADQLRGRYFISLIGADEQAKAAAVLSSDGVAETELHLVSTDGDRVTVLLSKAPVHYQQQNFMLLLVTDLTRVHRAEEKLRLFSEAIEQAGESVIITDPDGTIVYVNNALLDITGYSEDEVVGQNPRMFKSGAQDLRFYRKMWQAITAGENWQGKLINRKKSGKTYPVMLTISPIRNRDGHISHFVGLQQNLEEFEGLQNQLRQAQKMEAIGTLVGGIAHDFNNSLAAMIGNLYLARKEARMMPGVVARLESVETLAYAASATIKQLLAFSRKAVVSMVPFSVVPFLKEIVKLVQVSLPENIDFSLQLCDEEIQVKGDVNQLQQVLMNLVNNAIDAVRAAPNPAVSVSLQCIDVDADFVEGREGCQPGRYACLAVADNGTGIAAEHVEHLFEPFFTTKEQGKGTGLGLAMVYGAVKTHGGFVDVLTSQAAPSGTTMRIFLPLSQIPVKAPDSVDTSVCKGNGETILLVDDDERVLTVACELLESLRYQVVTASDGIQAIEQFQAHRSEIVLLISDVVMPKLGGRELVRELRQLNPDLKVILVTGYDKSAALVSGYSGSSDIIISKPYSASRLSQVIRDVLAGSLPSV
ncbi:PAS domain S-box protein [Mariprofundus erugo]|uniref:PAS domain S-box protein n=1 Tax=Mariprofundus erugo TaxID=2528639 RepID=UPI0010FDE821|nr:PAS domain S-box protein [Mariprofundus erugo]TLS74564.1 PAS domain S-box protein [Mariprofundus erugo]